MSKFNFIVTSDENRDGWWVRLPHQCDTWDIAGEDEYLSMKGQEWATSHADAVAMLESFIAEAQEALEALKRGESFGDPSITYAG